MLTTQQRRLLDYIAAYQRNTGGVSPTYDEMALALGKRAVTGRSTIHKMLNCMQQRGVIRRLPFRSRAIEIIRPVRPLNQICLIWDSGLQQLVLWSVTTMGREVRTLPGPSKHFPTKEATRTKKGGA